MDQTFSARNLRRAWDLETRKGINLARALQRPGDPIDINLQAIKSNYSSTARARKALKELRKSGAPAAKVEKAAERVRTLRANRDELVGRFLARVRDSLEDPAFSIGLSVSYRDNGSDIYQLDPPYGINAMAIKALSLNVRRAFSLRHASRDDIMSQVTRLLNDHYPKSVVRADVSKFYESISHERLISSLRESSLLSTATLSMIKKLLANYAAVAGVKCGLPRGIGISADLSEVFMQAFDLRFMQHESVVFYTRFVDDVLVIASPGSGVQMMNELAADLEARGLSLNKSKSTYREMGNSGTLSPFPFLGYSLEYKGGKLRIGLSPGRIAKLERRLDASFASYAASRSASVRAKTMLMKRIRFLTTSTRLANNKRYAYVGILYSNRLVNDPADMRNLDLRLSSHISKLTDANLARKLRSFSFESGWENGTFTHHSILDFTEIASAWRKLG